MNPGLAKFLSTVFNPLWLPLISFLLITWLDPSLVYDPAAKKSIAILLLVNILLPAASILYLIRRGILSGVELMKRTERSVPYLLIIFYYSLFYFAIDKLHPVVSSYIYAMFLAIIASLIVAMVINLKWKISVHMMGIGGLAGSLTGLAVVHPEVPVFPFLILVILISGWLGFARIVLKAHTPSQVNAGFILGAGMQCLFIIYDLAFHFS